MNRPLLALLLIAVTSGAPAGPPEKVWETDAVFSGPESVAYDAERGVLYVSNLRKTRDSDAYYGDQFVSKLDLSGKVVDLKWIEGLSEPTGIAVFEDRLYIVERFGVAVVDLETETIIRRIRIEATGFLNDVDVAPDGTVFVSESDTENVYAIKDDKVGLWYSGEAVSHTNGVLVDDGRLLVAVNTDAALKAIDLESKKVTTLSPIKRGIIDGLRPIGDDVLVSLLEGLLYRVDDNGGVSEVLNTTGAGINIADFEYIEDRKLLIVPALWQHKVIAYRMK